VGEHEISLRLFRDVVAKVKLTVTAANAGETASQEPAAE
jgi:hypothetical protein